MDLFFNDFFLSKSFFIFLETFKKYFSTNENSQLSINNSNTNNKETSDNKGRLEQELEISQKIEDYVLKIVGKEVLVMDTIVFLLNKIMLPLLVLIFLNRSDLITVSYIVFFVLYIYCLILLNCLVTCMCCYIRNRI